VTQDDNLLPWRTALGNVELALECKGVARAERRERASDYLTRVGLKGHEELYPHELSGGMRKRVSIVRTLVDDSVDVILMDEPFGPLDAQTRLVLQDELLRLWQGTGRTIMFVTHDIVEAITLSDRIAIFTGVPGSIKAVRRVTLPRPRDVFHIHETPGFSDIYDAIWNDLREEILKERDEYADA
jgi:NitT/TauT family transport system ATP-binding protein